MAAEEARDLAGLLTKYADKLDEATYSDKAKESGEGEESAKAEESDESDESEKAEKSEDLTGQRTPTSRTSRRIKRKSTI